MRAFLIALAALTATVTASRVLHGQLSSNAHDLGWRVVGTPQPNTLIRLTVGIKHNAAGKAALEV